MAFNPEVIDRVRALAPRARTTLLVSRGAIERAGSRPEQSVDWAVAAGVTDLGVEYTLADERLVAAAHGAGLALGVWTVNDAAEIRRMLDLGVDIVTSDRPDLARRLQRGGA
jgi:glycerophosphoryl diester phosphodiesterase